MFVFINDEGQGRSRSDRARYAGVADLGMERYAVAERRGASRKYAHAKENLH